MNAFYTELRDDRPRASISTHGRRRARRRPRHRHLGEGDPTGQAIASRA
jgi:hypothetical protein